MKNLGFAGDRIYAGMNDLELYASVPGMAIDVVDPEGVGYFHYSPDTEEAQRRREELAKELHGLGLR